MTTTPLILASSSPYRRELLSRLALPFECRSPDIDESARPDEAPGALVERLAEAKARALAAEFPRALIIGSDQVAVLGDHIMGKPGTHDNAVEQLARCSGRTVTFYTGLCLLDTGDETVQRDCILFEVRFRTLNNAQIRRYLAHDKPYNSAGSFKAEGLGVSLFESMHGEDPTALIGLPLIRLTAMLNEAGVEIP
jgi:MAF protein